MTWTSIQQVTYGSLRMAQNSLESLNVTISAHMKVSEQCGFAAAKGNQIIGLIRRNITCQEKS